MPNAKLIARVVRATPTAFIVSWPGQLMFRPIPLRGGEAFQILASIHNTLTPELYELERAGIRGSYLNDSIGIEALYERYVERCKAGEYHLNPFAPPVDANLQQGVNGTSEAPEAAVSTIPATGEAAEAEAAVELLEQVAEAQKKSDAPDEAPSPAIIDDPPAAKAEVPSNDA